MSFELVGIRLEADNAAAYFGDMAKGSKATDAFSAATAAAAAQVNVFDDSMRKAKIETLTDKLDSQQKKLKILEQELAEASKKYGEGSVQAQKKALAVDDLSKAIVQTEKKIESENATLGREKAAFDAAAHAASTSVPEVEKLGDATKQAGDDFDAAAHAASTSVPEVEKLGTATKQAGDNAEQSGPKWKTLSEIATGALRRIGEIAIDAFAQAGQAAIGFFTDSISVAGDFESGMNKFAAVAGGALDDAGLSLKDFRDQFIQIGKELPVSTQEVQQAAIEMVKGGIEPATIAAGGLRQVIQFAAAADLDLEEASTIAAKALGGWVDMAASAQEKADFLAHSTDLLSKAANASTVNVDDLALGLYNVQGTAKLAGVSFDETVTALAELAPSFASSADAGTSFKAFLSRLQPTTKPAIAAMKGLGLYTDKAGSAFYDAQGNFIGMEKVSGLLKDATKDLTEAQRSQVLQTIFGQDAIRVAAVLSEKGAEGYDAMTAALAKQNSVAEMAKQKQAGFNTALDNFKGSVEALQITIGSYLLPILTTLFNDYLAPGINILTDLAGALFGDEDAFNRLSPTMQSVVAWIGQLFSGTGGLSGIWTNTLLPAIQSAGAYFQENIVPILENLASIVFPLLGSGLQVLSGLWSNVLWPALKTVWDIFDTLIVPILKDVTEWLAENLPPAVQKLADFLTNTLFPAIHDVWDFIDVNLIPILKDVVKWLEENIPPAIQTAANFWNNTLWPALNKVWGFISTYVIPIFNSIINTVFPQVNEKTNAVAVLWNETLWPALKKIWAIIEEHIIPLFKAIARVLGAVVKKAIEEFTEKLNLAWEGLKKVSTFVVEHVLPDWENVKKGLEIVSKFIEKTIGPAITTFTNDVLKSWSEWFGKVGDGIQIVVNWLNALADAINSLPDMPDAMKGNSPPPMAKWMYEIGSQSAYAANAMSAVGSSIRGVPATPMAIMAAGSNTSTYNNQRSVNLNYHTTYAPPTSTSLAIANALA